MTDERKSKNRAIGRLARRVASITFCFTCSIFLILLFAIYLTVGASIIERAPLLSAIAITVAGSIVLGSLAFYGAKRTLQPFGLLASRLHKTAKGDLTADFSTSARGGLGFIAQNIQDMVNAFKDIIERIIVTTIDNVVTFGEEFKKVVSSAAESSIAQSSQADSIAAAARQMSVAAEAVSENTEAARGIAEHAMRTAKEGAVIASDTVDILHTVGASTGKLSEHVDELYTSIPASGKSRK